MTIDEAMQVLKRDRDLCMFNPTTGECEPMNEDCRRSAEAYDVILSEWENYKKLWEANLVIVGQANKVMENFTKMENELKDTAPYFNRQLGNEYVKGMMKRQAEVLDIIQCYKMKIYGYKIYGYGGFNG